MCYPVHEQNNKRNGGMYISVSARSVAKRYLTVGVGGGKGGIVVVSHIPPRPARRIPAERSLPR